jgi:hypothetical protein
MDELLGIQDLVLHSGFSLVVGLAALFLAHVEVELVVTIAAATGLYMIPLPLDCTKSTISAIW